MDVLQFEIRMAQNNLEFVARQWDAEQLEIGGILLQGDEVKEVLLAVRQVQEKKLDRLNKLGTQGATA